MRESIIIQKFQALEKFITSVAYHMQLGFSGSALHEETLKNLLIKKGIISEVEFKEQLGEEIKKVNDAEAKRQQEEEDKKKTELVKPTPDETAKITGDKSE